MEYRFFVEGHPEAQARPRFSLRNGYLRVHDKKESKDYKDKVYAKAHDVFVAGGSVTLKGALTLELTVYRMFPKSFSRIKQQLAFEERLMPDTKPDLDNYIKIALDGIGHKDYPKIIFDNDAQIVEIIAKKRFVRHLMIEGMDICIREYQYE